MRPSNGDREVPRNVLLISQVYLPDPAAVARLMSDVADVLAARGSRVTVLTADRGYDDPTVKYESGITRSGIVVRRLPFSSFGKRGMSLRVLAGVSFTLQAVVGALLVPGVQCVVVTTSPPMGSLAGVILGALRRIAVVYWPMDLNPDQTLSLKLKSDRALTVRLLEWLNRAILRRANTVIALDRFMAHRLEVKHPVSAKLVVVPPWGEEDEVEHIPHDENPFRRQHGLDGKIVVMYSGTLSTSNPIDTLLDAAEEFEDDPRLVFVFVGGGFGMQNAKARRRPNIMYLGYEPLDRMKYSLAAADVHVVSLGESMVGIVHPCKVYGAMATGRPILFIGPDESHVTDMMTESSFGWHIRHGDVPAARAALREILNADPGSLHSAGQRAQALINHTRAKRMSSRKVADAIEGAMVRSASSLDPRDLDGLNTYTS